MHLMATKSNLVTEIGSYDDWYLYCHNLMLLCHEFIAQNASPNISSIQVEYSPSSMDSLRVEFGSLASYREVFLNHSPNSRCCSRILSRFARAAFRFSACIFDRSIFKHSLTFSLASLQLPTALCMKPWLWHCSRAAMTSSHAVTGVSA